MHALHLLTLPSRPRWIYGHKKVCANVSIAKPVCVEWFPSSIASLSEIGIAKFVGQYKTATFHTDVSPEEIEVQADFLQ